MKYIVYKEDFTQKIINDELLKYSSNKASLEKVRELIKKGANVNCKNNYGNTPLIYSIKYSFTSCSKLLIEYGADVNIVNNYGETALIYLAGSISYKNFRNIEKPSIPIIDLLINSNIDLNKKNIEGKDAFDINKKIKIYVKSKYPDKYKEYLIKKDADKYNL